MQRSTMMYFDWTYFFIVLPAMIFAMIASAGVNSTFAKYSKQYSRVLYHSQ